MVTILKEKTLLVNYPIIDLHIIDSSMQAFKDCCLCITEIITYILSLIFIFQLIYNYVNVIHLLTACHRHKQLQCRCRCKWKRREIHVLAVLEVKFWSHECVINSYFSIAFITHSWLGSLTCKSIFMTCDLTWALSSLTWIELAINSWICYWLWLDG